VLLLLPPSEGKRAPVRGLPLDLAALSWPHHLSDARAEVLEALVALCTGSPDGAADVLGLGPTQAHEVARNARLRGAPTARADHVYRGVLYEALDLPGLDGAARRRAAARLAVTSALFGLLRPTDRVPAYRLSGAVTLPGLGPVAAHWSRHLAPAVEEAAHGGLVVDLRSATYASFWRPSRTAAGRSCVVRVLHEVGRRRTVVSHANKATKGRLVRDLLASGASPRTPTALAEALRDLGWYVEQGPVTRGRPVCLDVVVRGL
jgi:cytoplasmic iron level regulating protein YaaA (DUF328/UPF0246 family)